MSVPFLLVLGLALATLAASALGSTLLLRGGLHERRGQIRLARRIARTGGFLLAAGCTGQAVFVLFLAARPGLAALAAALAVASGFTGLLGGLSGKPRPSGSFATAFWVASILLGLRALAVL